MVIAYQISVKQVWISGLKGECADDAEFGVEALEWSRVGSSRRVLDKIMEIIQKTFEAYTANQDGGARIGYPDALDLGISGYP